MSPFQHRNCPKVQDRRFEAAILHLKAVPAATRTPITLQQNAAHSDPRTASTTLTNNQR